jgi:hypothetical protein
MMLRMRSGRRARGFESLGRVGPTELGLPAREARRLLLAHAWRSAVGDAIAKRLQPVRVVRGTVEIEADALWARDLRDVLPSLAGRLARAAPELGVQRFRLRVLGDERVAEAHPIAAAPEIGALETGQGPGSREN